MTIILYHIQHGIVNIILFLHQNIEEGYFIVKIYNSKNDNINTNSINNTVNFNIVEQNIKTMNL